ncbi:MAG: CAAX prenyl protease-related protein [Phycisphaerales bacterium]|nr:CAAX prenyl protease-related protein [Phycisphaerales bacterium]
MSHSTKPPVESVSSPPPSSSRIRDDVAYILPMGVFLALTQVGVQWPGLYAISYIAKTLIVAVLLVVLWRQFTKIRWTHWQLGVLVGVLGIVQWVGMEKLLLHWWPNYPRLSAEPYDPTAAMSGPMLWLFYAVRWGGASLLVPVMEELFWRDFAWRTIAAPNDFKLAEVGEWDPTAFFLVSLIFSCVHIQWMTAIVWALMIGGLLIYTRSIGACIIAHGVTNFLLGAYVLGSHYLLHQEQWYFW